MDAYRPMSYAPWWAISTLRPPPPVRPSESLAGTDVIVASESLTAPQKAAEDAAGSARGVTMQLDIRFWRTRWWWRLAVKAAVRYVERTV
jgi:hypothetical protein